MTVFCSVVLFALLVLEGDFPGTHSYYELIALAIVGSIVLQSTTDFVVARWLARDA